LGMMIGLTIFSVGLKRVTALQRNPLTAMPGMRLSRKIGFFICCLITVWVISLVLHSTTLAKYLLPSLGVCLLIFLFVLAARQQPPYRQNLLILNALILSSIVYWMFFLQIFFSSNLFVERLVDKYWLGIHIPTTVFYSLEAVFIIILGPVFAWYWQTLNLKKKNPPPFLKFILAISLAGLGFLTLTISTHFADAAHLVNPLWIVLAYLLITLGELLLSPIGLSAVTTLAPQRLVGMMMGIWFVALGFGGQFAGRLAKLSNVPESVTDHAIWLTIYRSAFLDYACIAFGISAALFLMQLALKIFMKHKNEELRSAS
jgi:POT family proton-dependent oligopeptide transporter